MKIHEILKEENLNELNWRKTAATGALALGALGSIGQANANDAGSRRVTIGPDGQTTQSAAQQMAQQGVKPSVEKPGAVMPNQDLDTIEKVEKFPNGSIKVYHDGETYDGVEVPYDAPIPRGAKKLKIQKSQMGFRSIGNFTVYLTPIGKAYIYSK